MNVNVNFYLLLNIQSSTILSPNLLRTLKKRMVFFYKVGGSKLETIVKNGPHKQPSKTAVKMAVQKAIRNVHENFRWIGQWLS